MHLVTPVHSHILILDNAWLGNKGITKAQNSKTKHQNTMCDPNIHWILTYKGQICDQLSFQAQSGLKRYCF